MLKIEDVLEILSIPLLGIIPESEEVLRASNLGTPVTLNNPASAPARAYLDAARRLKGESVDMTVRNRDGAGSVRQAVRTEGGMNLLSFFSKRKTAPIAGRGTASRSCSHTNGPPRAPRTFSSSCEKKSCQRCVGMSRSIPIESTSRWTRATRFRSWRSISKFRTSWRTGEQAWPESTGGHRLRSATEPHWEWASTPGPICRPRPVAPALPERRPSRDPSTPLRRRAWPRDRATPAPGPDPVARRGH